MWYNEVMKHILYGFSIIFLFSSCIGPFSGKKRELPKELHPAHHETTILSKDIQHYKELLKDPHPEIRLAAGKVLFEFGEPSGEEALLEALKGEDLHHRLDSFIELSEKPNPNILEALQSAISAEKDAMVRFVMKRNLKQARKKLNLE